MANPPVPIAIPGQAIVPGSDLRQPTTDLLESLNLLPGASDLQSANGIGSTFGGPPDSVMLIEAGATAASKWWASGIAAGSVISTGTVLRVWDSLGPGNQPLMLLSLAIVLGAAVLGIAHLLASDVRGRAAVMVATIEARRDVATTMVRQAGASYQAANPTTAGSPPIAAFAGAAVGASASPGTTIVALPAAVADNGLKLGADEPNWKAYAYREQGDHRDYLLVKGTMTEWVPLDKVNFH